MEDCDICSSGYFCVLGAISEAPCGPGLYSPESSGVCYTCAPGHYCSGAANAETDMRNGGGEPVSRALHEVRISIALVSNYPPCVVVVSAGQVMLTGKAMIQESASREHIARQGWTESHRYWRLSRVARGDITGEYSS